eukprot:scaffold26701_cov77-Skeletonema_dohrnii-CCMP3373.AAC.2
MQMGRKYYNEGNYRGAFEVKGLGVEKVKKKESYRMEEAAIAGHPMQDTILDAMKCRIADSREQ